MSYNIDKYGKITYSDSFDTARTDFAVSEQEEDERVRGVWIVGVEGRELPNGYGYDASEFLKSYKNSFSDPERHKEAKAAGAVVRTRVERFLFTSQELAGDQALVVTRYYISYRFVSCDLPKMYIEWRTESEIVSRTSVTFLQLLKKGFPKTVFFNDRLWGVL